MERRISFGKIAYNNPSRKTNEVTIDIELRDNVTNGGYQYKELAISGDIWNARHTDCICGGQCLDEIKKYVDTPLFNEIYQLWEEWHLNSINAGTPEQTEAIQKWLNQGNKYDYEKAIEHLQDLDLYAVYWTGHTHSKDYDNEPYIYGTEWIVRDLPENVIQRVTEIINGVNC